MKVLKLSDGVCRIFRDNLVVDKKLDPVVYQIKFDPMTGFFLEKHTPLTVKEKLYGNHEKKIEKIMRSFDKASRSLGVIFSGKKGSGKSIAGRLLSERMNQKGFPVILVNEYISGIETFIDSIEQECMIFFDEFEKTFREKDDGDVDPQSDMLSLFDGTNSDTKRMYVITCNDKKGLDQFILNRPGRFHYHICWNPPSPEEIKEYLKDKLEEKYYGEIEKVVNFSLYSELNFDCLHAISFELNIGSSFEEAIEDINISKGEEQRFYFSGEMSDGTKFFCIDSINIFEKSISIEIQNELGNYIGYAIFNSSEIKIDKTKNKLYIDPEKVKYNPRYEENKKGVKFIKFLVCRERDIISKVRFY